MLNKGQSDPTQNYSFSVIQGSELSTQSFDFLLWKVQVQVAKSINMAGTLYTCNTKGHESIYQPILAPRNSSRVLPPVIPKLYHYRHHHDSLRKKIILP